MSEKASPPVVRTKAAGRVSDTLERFAEFYKKNNPGFECRWIFDPQHKPELSAKMGRLATGYKTIFFKDLGNAEELQALGMSGKPDDEIRVADVVLMGIPAALKQAAEKENVLRAQEQARSVDRAYHDALNAANAGLPERHRSRAIGRSVIEEREFEFDIEQREGE